jgi:hypothetical protein
MRSNTYYHNLSRVPDKQNPERARLEEQIKKYLATGGTVTQVERGVSAINPLTYHDPRKKK